MDFLWLVFVGFHSFSSEPVKGSDSGLYGFLGADVGYSNVKELTLDKENRDGAHFMLRTDASYYLKSFVFDLGGGWFFNEVKNKDATVTTRAAFIDLSAKWRTSRRWSLGPVVQVAMGSDVTFSDVEGKNSVETLAGLRFDYEPELFESYKFRVSTNVFHDVSIKDQNALMATIGFHIGIPFTEKVREKVVYKYIPKIVKVGDDSLRATFDGDTGLYFDTNKWDLKPKMAAYLKRLAFFLKKYQEEWTSIKVIGHTDDVGTDEYNMTLSQKRAQSVAGALEKEGLDKAKMEVEWHGESKPLVENLDDQARAKNRRVEIEFLGVRNTNFFYRSLSIIR